jgi:thymidylate synthase
MTSVDDTYLALVRHVLEHGVNKSDRTGTGTRSVSTKPSPYSPPKNYTCAQSSTNCCGS